MVSMSQLINKGRHLTGAIWRWWCTRTIECKCAGATWRSWYAPVAGGCSAAGHGHISHHSRPVCKAAAVDRVDVAAGIGLLGDGTACHARRRYDSVGILGSPRCLRVHRRHGDGTLLPRQESRAREPGGAMQRPLVARWWRFCVVDSPHRGLLSCMWWIFWFAMRCDPESKFGNDRDFWIGSSPQKLSSPGRIFLCGRSTSPSNVIAISTTSKCLG
jgi:hypothetical protein